MKKLSIATIVAIIAALLVATIALAAFTNGDFESGDFTGWTKATFLNGGYPTRDAGGADLSAVLGPYATFSQTDPYSNGEIKYPPYGQYVARVNSEASHFDAGYPANGNTISQLVTVASGDVDPTDGLVHVRFVYAGVMVNPLDHLDSEKPYIYVVVKNHTKGDDIMYEFQSYAGEVGKGWKQGPLFSGSDYWQYLDWQFVDLASSVAHPVEVGDELYVEVTASGCSPTGHPGYAYVDRFNFLLPAPTITATDSPDPVHVNNTLTYTFNYQAINAVANPVIYIPIPAGTTFSSVSDTAHCAYSAAAPASVTCNMPSLASGASGAPFTMSVTVTNNADVTLQNYTVHGDGTDVNTGSPVLTTVLNSAPVAVADTYSTPVNTLLNGTTVLTNDTDADLNTLTAVQVTGPSHAASFTFNPNGTFAYTPVTGFSGQDSFTYKANDGFADSNTVTVTIDVVPTLTITGSGAATIKPGDQYVYTFAYTVNATTLNTQVAFTLPGHATFVSNTGGYTCTPAAGLVTCDLGTVSSNGSFTATVLVDRLKKVNTPLTLAATSYSIDATSAVLTNGSATVTANTITPFTDVPAGHWALDFVQSIWAYGITSGCVASPLTYCPNSSITRADMAVYIERARNGSSYSPGVLPLTFTDTTTHYARYFIEALKNDGITAGCGGTLYCPNSSITRGQAAVFLLRGLHGSSYYPPAATGTAWLDVAITHWSAPWVEELKNANISAGCGGGKFCPDGVVSRAEMAVLVQRTFSLPMPTP